MTGAKIAPIGMIGIEIGTKTETETGIGTGIEMTTETEGTRGETVRIWNEIEMICGRAKNALDYFCDSFGHVGAGIGHFVYDGRVRPHPIGHCPDSASGQPRSGAKSLVAVSAW
jgi:hypothetical protein